MEFYAGLDSGELNDLNGNKLKDHRAYRLVGVEEKECGYYIQL